MCLSFCVVVFQLRGFVVGLAEVAAATLDCSIVRPGSLVFFRAFVCWRVICVVVPAPTNHSGRIARTDDHDVFRTGVSLRLAVAVVVFIVVVAAARQPLGHP
jgi:hypothetical protein